MKFIESKIDGVFLVEENSSMDDRGEFIKFIHCEEFDKINLPTDFKESYYTISKKDVIRGMHFQLPPFDHEKLITVLKGSIVDVIVDLRKTSSTYKTVAEFQLNASLKQSLYLPKGIAHGFKSLADDTLVLYHVTTVYHNESDTGILYSSIPYNWNCEEPVVSKRDLSFVSLEEFRSPF